jgi:hypothetical protein
MSGELETILRLVAEGKLAPDEAAPIIEALTERRSASPEPSREDTTAPPPEGRAGSRRVRIQVSERGRRVVDVRVPLAFAAFAARSVPGMPDRYANLIQEAIESNTTGPIVDTEDESGDRVLITLE